ncbi:TPA: hypothetical protein OXB05_002688 [Clostridioides difficile]|uniref:hypothetical protein n=1 Tax=Clostridioides difficile TaxID=1496 RepID=UPI000980115A|nr:hypothetical protein [Clostridioides difficile]EGT3815746.1 hypothetical protein [Clostridioides difficile]EGT3826833.1 hypothetical protein [Clostridioides difficile]EGT4890986.1 hypothetical protein [Clostridioides difficile]EKS6802483.1 hypothetical protein [Clostridioides difficile]EKS7167061.1 hypothetical protein [Clostridioides difficile]
MTEKLTNNASLRELMTTLQGVQTDFQNSKSNITTVLGSPFLNTDKLDITKTKIETLKSALVNNLIYKGVSASTQSSFTDLINAINFIVQSILIVKCKDTERVEEVNNPYIIYNDKPNIKGCLRIKGTLMVYKNWATFASSRLEIIYGEKKEYIYLSCDATASGRSMNFEKDIIVNNDTQLKIQVLLTDVGTGNSSTAKAYTSVSDVTLLR